ncbi:MAG: LemA family protein, partial [Arenicellales bacterium]|nr:LemA family protein [Arenicellales bacterium]
MDIGAGSIVLAIAILVVAWVIWIYNRFIRGKNEVREAWSGIDVQLKRRHNLIPNLVETVKGYSSHERETLDELTRTRTGRADDTSVTETAREETLISQALGNLLAVAE